MGKYYLRRDIYYCLIDDTAIFLDLVHGKYFAVNSEDLGELGAAVHGWPVRAQAHKTLETKARTSELIDQLLAAGRLVTSADAGQPACPTMLQTRRSAFTGWVNGKVAPMSLVQLYRFSVSYLHAFIYLRLGRLHRLIERLRVRRCSGRVSLPVRDDAQVFSLVRLYRKLQVFLYSAREHCLLDSLVLTDFLARNGVESSLVIGVSTRPFVAHAWVQLGNVVLNDNIESVQEFTPILAV
jgi:hypothetical protein